jgi:hypothetical protein
MASLLLGASFLLLTRFTATAQNTQHVNSQAVVITIAGIVVDAASLQPVEGARVVCDKNNTVAITDKRGFYTIQLSAEKGEFQFKLKVEKDGYKVIFDQEHWGDLSEKKTAAGYSRSLLYFGMRKKADKDNNFVLPLKAGKTTDALDYEAVLSGLTIIKENRQSFFANKIDSLKKNNQLVLLQYGDKFYMVSNGGYVAIGSIEDVVLVDRLPVKAKELNDRLKRSNIKSLSPAESGSSYKAIITTRPGLR